MKIPDKVYDPEYANGVVYYLKRKAKHEQPYEELKFPRWLVDLIAYERKVGMHTGRYELANEVRNLLNIQ